MRLEVTRWSRVEDRNNSITYKAVTTATYLDADEVAHCGVGDYTQEAQGGLFLLRFDVRYLREDAIVPLRLLAAQIIAEIERQEDAKTRAERNALAERAGSVPKAL